MENGVTSRAGKFEPFLICSKNIKSPVKSIVLTGVARALGLHKNDRKSKTDL